MRTSRARTQRCQAAVPSCSRCATARTHTPLKRTVIASANQEVTAPVESSPPRPPIAFMASRRQEVPGAPNKEVLADMTATRNALDADYEETKKARRRRAQAQIRTAHHHQLHDYRGEPQ